MNEVQLFGADYDKCDCCKQHKDEIHSTPFGRFCEDCLEWSAENMNEL